MRLLGIIPPGGVVKVGGLNVETQLVSGDIGLSKNEATTFWAQGLAGEPSGKPNENSAP